MKIRALLSLALAFILCTTHAVADPIPVRQSQGATRGFLIIRDDNGKLLAHGDLTQVAHGDHLVSRFTFRFLDGSLDDETTVFTQRGTFHMVSDHHIQRGPYFPTQVDAFVDAASGQVTVKSVDKDGKPKQETQHMDIPPDTYNGMIGTLLLNVPADTAPFKVTMVAPTGKGRLIKLNIAPESKQPFIVTGLKRTATAFRIKIELGGIAGVVAPVVGKQPADVFVWVLEGDVPAFVREIGQLYEGGPIVSLELAGTSFVPPAKSAKP